ncbi:MAG: hypothetical protein ACI89L_000068 [Phycisphaerales bacterium]|jgi:hypothetical protein
MWFPVGDWQFWVGTLVVLGAALWIGRGLARGLLPSKRKHQKKVTLTVMGSKAGSSKRAKKA